MSHNQLSKHKSEHHEHPINSCDGEGHEHHHHSDGSCCCHQHEQEFHGIQRLMLARLIIAAAVFAVAVLSQGDSSLSSILFVVSALISGYDLIYAAVINIFTSHVVDEYFLMTFVAIAACVIGEFEEAAAVFLLFRVGDTCQSYAIRHSRKKLSLVFSEHVHIKHESKKTAQLLTRFSRLYTPIIIISAVIIAVLIPILSDTELKDAVYRSLSFLVLACPCSIVISVPMAYSAGIAAASGKQIFFRDSTAIDCFSKKTPYSSEMSSAIINEKDSFIYSSDGSGALEHSDVVILGKEEGRVNLAGEIARRTKGIVLQNIYFTIIIKLAVLLLAAIGRSQLWFSVFADSGVTVLAVLNSLRALYLKR